MADYCYILIHEDGRIELFSENEAKGRYKEWIEAVDAGVLEVLRVADWPDRLNGSGEWALIEGISSPPTGDTEL